MAGDLYPLATNIELTRIQDYNSQARLIIKTEPTGRVRQEMYIGVLPAGFQFSNAASENLLSAEKE